MTLSPFIDDGYNRNIYIEGVDRLYPAVRLTIRPMTSSDRAAYSATLSRVADKAMEREAAKMVCDRIISWDMVGRDGEKAPVQTEMVLKLQPALFSRIYEAIAGLRAGDPDPNEPAPESPSASPGEVEAADQKN